MEIWMVNEMNFRINSCIQFWLNKMIGLKIELDCGLEWFWKRNLITMIQNAPEQSLTKWMCGYEQRWK